MMNMSLKGLEGEKKQFSSKPEFKPFRGADLNRCSEYDHKVLTENRGTTELLEKKIDTADLEELAAENELHEALVD